MGVKEPQDLLKEQIDRVKEWLLDSDGTRSKSKSIIITVGIVLLAILFLTPAGHRILFRLPFISYNALNILRLVIGLLLGVFIAVKVINVLIKGNVLTKEMVAQEWPPQLIESRENAIDEILKTAEELISGSADSCVKVEKKNLSAGYVQSFLGGRELPCLDVYHTKIKAIKPFHMYIFFREYGSNILTTWYLAGKPTPLENTLILLSRLPLMGLVLKAFYFVGRYGLGRGPSGILGLDLFAKQDLSAYVATTHQCLLKAVDEYGKAHNIDTSKINRNTEGFLGIS